MTEPMLALLAQDGIPCAAQACTQVLLFFHEQEGWVLQDEIPWRIQPGTPDDIRDQVRSLILELGKCRIVVGAEISGLIYHVFDRMGFDIFQTEAVDDVLFDSILEDISATRAEQKAEEVATGPVRVDNQGRWYLDLVGLQERHPEISSKKVLREFFQTNRTFYELTVRCTHVPPWLEPELLSLRLVCRAETGEDGTLQAVITRGVCK